MKKLMVAGGPLDGRLLPCPETGELVADGHRYVLAGNVLRHDGRVVDPARYRPRGDYVILRLSQRDLSEGGVVLPEVGNEGKVWTVVAHGPDVKDLAAGDVVMPMGEVGQDIAALPRERGLYILRQANVLLVVQPEEE